MKFLKFILFSWGCLFFMNPVNAQMSANPPEVGKKIRAMGTDFNRKVIGTTMKIYGPLLAKAPKDGVTVSLNQSYGPHERNVLDIYQPKSKSGSLPIVIFFHGGGFVRGDKKTQGNLGTYFARNNVVGMMANYRLAPKSKWPSGPEDIATAIKWVKQNGTKFGGDHRKIFLMGGSAGTGHVGSYVFFEKYHVRDDGVKGAILVSGPSYDLSTKVTPKGVLGHPGERAYFGADASKYSSMSAINNIEGRKIPVFIAYAELDMPMIQNQNLLLINALYKRDKLLPTVKQVLGHNHMSILKHINTKDESLGPDLLEFIKIRSMN